MPPAEERLVECLLPEDFGAGPTMAAADLQGASCRYRDEAEFSVVFCEFEIEGVSHIVQEPPFPCMLVGFRLGLGCAVIGMSTLTESLTPLVVKQLHSLCFEPRWHCPYASIYVLSVGLLGQYYTRVAPHTRYKLSSAVGPCKPL